MATAKKASQLEKLQRSLETVNQQIEATEAKLKSQKDKKKKLVKQIEEIHMNDVKKLIKDTGMSAAEIKDNIIKEVAPKKAKGKTKK